MQATTSIIARSAVRSRGSRRAGAIWLIDSSPEKASHELAKPDQERPRVQAPGPT